jgi:tetratricopeptide (TPR) repeat protein
MEHLDADLIELAAALRDPEVWQPQRLIPTPKPERVAALANFKKRLDDEDAAASSLLDEALKGPAAWWANSLRKSGVRTAGVVRQLLTRMRAVSPRVPADALVGTTLAVEIADSLAVTEYPSDFVITLRAQALRDQAWGLSVVGRFREATAAADRAERLLLQTPIPDYELARLNLVRVGSYRWTDRIDDAIVLSRKAAEVFERFGDRRLFVTARNSEGAMLFGRHEYGPALAAYRSVENDPAIPDDATRVAIRFNIGLCHRELGHIEDAIQALTAATAEYEMLGMDANLARCSWTLATTIASAGRYSEAIPIFRKVWSRFESLEMESNAALAALDLAENLLVVGRADEVPAICRTLIDRFTRAGMGGSAMTALAFLRETVATGHATPSLVRHVHDFLRDVSRKDTPSPVQPLHLDE